MKSLVFIGFVLLAIVQWFVPVSTIFEQETLRTEGKLFRFKTQPVDPVDPYRGNYLTLYFDADRVPKADKKFDNGEKVYVVLAEDSEGFAKVVSVSATVPTTTADFVKAKIDDFSSENDLIEYPFKRFYVEESKAKEAERIYNENNSGDNGQVTYAEVYVKNGASAITDVKVGDESVVEIVRAYNLKMK